VCVEKYGVRYTKPSRFGLTSLTVSCVYKTGHAASSSYDNNQPSPFSRAQTYPLSVPCPYDGVTPVSTGWRSEGGIQCELNGGSEGRRGEGWRAAQWRAGVKGGGVKGGSEG
jgi:hypothetical protein